ncbi:PIN domain-containing protein [Candidatus Daviesbacteria bacterium]|nr:PIN domain-containing protein [Candidatus Daviesbacteria bacterium]
MLRENGKYVNLLKKLAQKDSLAISTITIAEIYKNIYPTELLKTERLLNELQNFDVTSTVAKQAGLYWQEYSKNLKNLSLIDCLIAATANMNEAILVSLNKKHFPMSDIKLLDF